jgi:hypothetical protein
VASIGARFGLTLFMSILVGIIFWKVGETDPAVQQNLQVRPEKRAGGGAPRPSLPLLQLLTLPRCRSDALS